MTTKQQLFWIYTLAFLFVGANLALVYFEIYLGLLLPAAGLIVWLALHRLDVVFLLVAFTTPLAINTEALDLGVGISLPSELLMAGILLIFMLRNFQRNHVDWAIIKHPVSLAIFANLIWIFITSISSEMPIVSFKFLAARIWFVTSCYFLAIEIFRDYKKIYRFIWCFTLPLAAVVVYTTVRLISYGVDKEHAHWVMDPFFKDHAIYGAVIAMFIPVIIGLVLLKVKSKTFRFFTMLLLILLVAGEIFSYSRAAWVSLVGAFGVFVLMWFKIKLKYVLTIVSVVGILGYLSFDQIIISLQRNKTDSGTDFAEHVQSISNIATDDSNLERLNRWNCALEIFEDYPFLGSGPGTYSFLYAPYQKPEFITLISTNFGDQGNAHSEFLGPLAEQGLLGFLSISALIFIVLYRGVKLYIILEDIQIKMLVITSLMGLITYYIHGVLNNYLDQDKAAVPFFAFTAIIVAVDLYHRKTQTQE